MSILILAPDNDTHACVVEHALAQEGIAVQRTCHRQLCEEAGLSFAIGGPDAGASWILQRPGCPPLRLDQVHVVWRRRIDPLRPATALDSSDHAYAIGEWAHFSRSLQYAGLGDAVWVNPVDCGRRAESKPLQLTLARECGLAIPETLISNDPSRVRQFLDRHEQCIFKPLRGHRWQAGERERVLYTARVRPADLPDAAVLRAIPGIFQPLLAKAFEVRAQFFGDACFAIRVDGANLDYGAIDWRVDQGRLDGCPSIRLPEAVYSACRALMRRLGILVGAFDFIVEPDGRWCFLEVNEAGQFLMLEQFCPELPMLDAFVQFIAAPEAGFTYRPTARPLRLADSPFLPPRRRQAKAPDARPAPLVP